jgi:hypothetical protein
MIDRAVLGDLDGTGTYVLRVSKEGFNVRTEPLGSRNISFDSRLLEMGTVIQSGLWVFGSGLITFPTMAYAPIVSIQQCDGAGQLLPLPRGRFDQINAHHTFSPIVGIVTLNTLEIRQYAIPWYDTGSVFGYGGTIWQYTIYGMGT